MIDKDTYKRELVRMWDSLRDDYIGYNTCRGVMCKMCPLHDILVDDIRCGNAIYTVKMINIVEKWAKENPPKKYKISRLEYDILKHLSDNTALMYITRSKYGTVYLFNEEPRKSSFHWYGNGTLSVAVLDELFQFVQWEDMEPTSIQDVLKNCEVKEDV